MRSMAAFSGGIWVLDVSQGSQNSIGFQLSAHPKSLSIRKEKL